MISIKESYQYPGYYILNAIDEAEEGGPLYEQTLAIVIGLADPVEL